MVISGQDGVAKDGLKPQKPPWSAPQGAELGHPTDEDSTSVWTQFQGHCLIHLGSLKSFELSGQKKKKHAYFAKYTIIKRLDKPPSGLNVEGLYSTVTTVPEPCYAWTVLPPCPGFQQLQVAIRHNR